MCIRDSSYWMLRTPTQLSQQGEGEERGEATGHPHQQDADSQHEISRSKDSSQEEPPYRKTVDTLHGVTNSAADPCHQADVSVGQSKLRHNKGVDQRQKGQLRMISRMTRSHYSKHPVGINHFLAGICGPVGLFVRRVGQRTVAIRLDHEPTASFPSAGGGEVCSLRA